MTSSTRHRSALGRVRRLFQRLVRPVDADILVYRHDGRTLLPAPFDLRPVDASNVDAAASMDPAERVREFHGFLERGDRGWYVYADGRVVHRSWAQRGPRTVPLWHGEGRYSIAADEVWIHYCETAPAARGLGIYPAVISAIAATARQEGAKGVLISTERSNIASHRGILRAGFSPECEIRIRIRLGIASQSSGPVLDASAVPA